LRNRLWAAAETEIAAARKIDAAHPKIPVLEARLRLARQQPASRQPARPDDRRPVAKPLDIVIRNLPTGSVEAFTNNVQPLLLNYCARAGCHGPQSTAGMRLERVPPSRYAGRKSTQRNLSSVLAMIDREKPEASKLLVAPIRPHGGADLPIFTDRQQSQYKQLVQWVYQVAGAGHPTAPPTVAGGASPLSQRGPHSDENPPNADATPTATIVQDASTGATLEGAAAGAPNRVPPGAAASLPSSAAQGVAGVSPNPATNSSGSVVGSSKISSGPVFVPKDPFDPEIFNRRFFSPK
jgi:hypothetical protein